MFGRGLDRIKGPCMWDIITVRFCLMANAPYFPGVGVYIDRCFTKYTCTQGSGRVKVDCL